VETIVKFAMTDWVPMASRQCCREGTGKMPVAPVKTALRDHWGGVYRFGSRNSMPKRLKVMNW